MTTWCRVLLVKLIVTELVEDWAVVCCEDYLWFSSVSADMVVQYAWLLEARRISDAALSCRFLFIHVMITKDF